jgi:hypothetical protein
MAASRLADVTRIIIVEVLLHWNMAGTGYSLPAAVLMLSTVLPADKHAVRRQTSKPMPSTQLQKNT